jgi:hypothetical protein
VDEEQFERLAQGVYRMLRSRYRIDAERCHHTHTVHPPWLNVINISTFAATRKTSNRQTNAEFSDLISDRHLAALVQVVDRVIAARLRWAQERSGRFY